MKRLVLLMTMLLAGATGRADEIITNWSSGFAGGGVIPDGNLAGWSDTRTLGGIFDSVADVNVSLTLSGGYNGDLFAYVVHESGFAVLLNRVGRDGSDPFGYGNAGMSVTYDDSAATDIHFYGGSGVPVGSYQPDARNISPLSSGTVLAGFDRANSGAWLSSFTNDTANGNWTLFVSDVAGGNGSPTVVSWGLDMVVPEPSATALIVLAGLIVTAGRCLKSRRRI